MKRFKEKVVIVTGAGSGIGQATAIRFAKEGAKVVLVGRTQSTLEATSKRFPQDNTWIHTDNHLTVTCDITQQSQVHAMVGHVLKKFERIDVLVNAAGKTVHGNVSNLTAEEWRAAMDVNLNGTFNICQAVMPALIEFKGCIISVSALSVIQDDKNTAVHNAAMAGVVNLARTLAVEHGPNGVRINTVTTSVINEINQGGKKENSNGDTGSTSLKNPLQRLATPNDVAAAVTFLASDDACMITGIHLPVDGGLSAANKIP